MENKYFIYIYRKSASRFSRGTVLNTLKQSRINIMRGKNDATTYPNKPVSRIASLFRGLMKEYSCDYRVYSRKIYIIHGKLKNFKVHTASFRHAKHKNSTKLSKHIWTIKNDNIDYSISWRILSSNSPYNSSSKRCNLCLKEKFLIIYRPNLSSLNKRNELISSCRHRNKALLTNS